MSELESDGVNQRHRSQLHESYWSAAGSCFVRTSEEAGRSITTSGTGPIALKFTDQGRRVAEVLCD